jgi:8-hydroxy-5-deazaflavin:NADPH oxidoreductase
LTKQPNSEEPIMPIAPPQPTRRNLFHLAGSAVVALAAGPRGALAQSGSGGQPLKIATIGAGREGSALGALFAKAGHTVMFSSRHPEGLKDFVAGVGPLAKAGTVAEAAAFGDVVLLVVPYTAVAEIGKEYGTALAAKKLVIDVSNPIARRDGEELVKQVNDEGGAGIATQKALPGAHLVRGFNAIGSGQLADLAHRQGEPVGIPIAGDDQAALKLASDLIRQIGFEPVVVGGLAMGKYLVPGTPLGGVHTPAEVKQITATLK